MIRHSSCNAPTRSFNLIRRALYTWIRLSFLIIHMNWLLPGFFSKAMLKIVSPAAFVFRPVFVPVES
jgi:hypothetical protein